MDNNKFCSVCGSATALIIPPGEDRYRSVCEACQTVHYENPKVVVGCIVEQEEQILLCKRAIEPQHGKWTIPAGYLENNETTTQGAIRETLEECGAKVERIAPYRIFDLPHFSQIYFLFRAQLITCPFLPTHESSEVKLFKVDDIPWNQLAFKVIATTLEHYLDDAAGDSHSFEHHIIAP